MPGTLMPPWKPGQSGNPGGRPKMTDEEKALLKEIALESLRRQREAVAAPDTRIETVLDMGSKALDRIYGKPVQEVDATIATERPIVFDPAFNEVDDAANGEAAPSSS